MVRGAAVPAELLFFLEERRGERVAQGEGFTGFRGTVGAHRVQEGALLIAPRWNVNGALPVIVCVNLFIGLDGDDELHFRAAVFEFGWLAGRVVGGLPVVQVGDGAGHCFARHVVLTERAFAACFQALVDKRVIDHDAFSFLLLCVGMSMVIPPTVWCGGVAAARITVVRPGQATDPLVHAPVAGEAA